jgi:serine/threonine protein kinase
MESKDRWLKIVLIGEGGQGVVHRVVDKNRFPIQTRWGNLNRGMDAFTNLRATTIDPTDRIFDYFSHFQEGIIEIIDAHDKNNHGALKELHDAKDARDNKNAEERLRREINAMSAVNHPNLLKIIDSDPDGKWYVSPFFSQGTLSDDGTRFKGDFIGALKAVRPLIEGVAKLHDENIVHRDIKPKNIFINNNGGMVLGDFGLIYFINAQHARISNTFENVGSTDWMPQWAARIRIEDIRPSFDVYSLGKLIWFMVSGQQVLPLWYYQDDEYNLEILFPNAPYIEYANKIFQKCIVEKEKDCLPNATALLTEINDILNRTSRNTDLSDLHSSVKCKVCGNGNYKMMLDFNDRYHNMFGTNCDGPSEFKMYSCNNCGNVQFFHHIGKSFWTPK